MWPSDGPFVFDICTMWDIYRTQLPLITALFPARAVELANALLTICEEEGNLPIGYRMAKGADRFTRQGSALAHTFLADLCQLGMPGIDWDWALCHMDADLRRHYGEDYLLRGLAEPITHTLDLAVGYQCTAKVAHYVGDNQLATQFERLAGQWINAFNPDRRPAASTRRTTRAASGTIPSGCCTTCRHASPWLAAKAGSSSCWIGSSVTAPTPSSSWANGRAPRNWQPGTRCNRFEGLNNEPDMEAPWAYHYAGRPDRTAEVVHAAVNNMFGLGRGGLPGNDDSGGLSSWYVWASLGLFPIAGQSLYLLNAPSFAESRIAFADQELVIECARLRRAGGRRSRAVRAEATFNGELLDRTWLTARELHRGGHLELQLGPKPSAWGTTTRPPSASQPDAMHPPAAAAAPAPARLRIHAVDPINRHR